VQFNAVRFSPEGNVGNPELASAEKGSILLRAATAALARVCGWLVEQEEETVIPPPHVK
jgi:creatinine amidohydrolase/Fe(II)-dependent formamide hydrolase-like protein